MSGKVPLAVARAGWLRANDRMTVERAQAAFLVMYERARGGYREEDMLPGAPTRDRLEREVNFSLVPTMFGSERQRAVLFAQALRKARGKIQP